MTTQRVNRYLAQKEMLKSSREIREIIKPYGIRMPVLTNESGCDGKPDDVLSELTRYQQQELKICLEPISVSSEEADAIISELRSRWDNNQMNLLLGNCKSSVLSSVVGPFGLGFIVAKMDKDGGNVTTVHNAKKDIYANPEDEYRRLDYAGSAYDTARNRYKDVRIIENSQLIMDEYSGDYYDYSQIDCDHIKSVKEYHQEGGFMQSAEQRKQFGSDSGNFAMTLNKGNRSLQDNGKLEWQQKQASDGSGRNNKERFGHDNRRVNAALKRGKSTAAAYAPTFNEKVSFYAQGAAITGSTESAKMGLQQSLGLFLTEFFSATFDEIIDAYKNGFKDSLKSQGFFEALRIRLNRVAERVSARWKDALIAFKDGAISGFLSNLITMLINMLVTTGKRIVRVIREGFMSILKAVKMVLFPPEGMTYAEAGDAALKLLATGITVSLGILTEEVVEKSVSTFFAANMPPLAPYAGMVSTVFVGAMTGIASALIVYALDKLDILGVQNQRKHDFIINELDNLIAESDSNINTMYEDEMGRMDVFLTQLQDA